MAEDGKSGFLIWKSGSFINLVYMVCIPGIVPFLNGQDKPLSFFIVYPLVINLCTIGGLYFWGSCLKCIGPFNPDICDPFATPNIEEKDRK